MTNTLRWKNYGSLFSVNEKNNISFCPLFQDGECQKDWKLVEGQCLYYHPTEVTWHEASTLCRIVEARLMTNANATSVILPRGRHAWFGVRSCPSGRLYSEKGVLYNKSGIFTEPTCMRAERKSSGETKYRTVECHKKLPFVCQKGCLIIYLSKSLFFLTFFPMNDFSHRSKSNRGNLRI